ncbi:MAG TPA: CbtB-domain containing protein [Dehalococcoidia bacterium]|nr:CbtB-domain containing protein [Dehalococcoidia bacterium]
MAATIQGMLGQGQVSKWLPWILGATIGLYMVGFVDGSVHASAIGGSTTLAYVHEFFHHARHVALMCH